MFKFMKLLNCIIIPLTAAACMPAANSALKSAQISNEESAFLQLWTSKKIDVCFINPEAAPAYLEAIKSAVVREYARAGFDLSRGWTACPDVDLAHLPNNPTFSIKFLTDADPHLGGTTPTGAFYGRYVPVALRSDPLTYIDNFCQAHPETCMQQWAVHEFGHGFGLQHNHMHPMEKTADGYRSLMPVHIMNSDVSYKMVNYLGDHDPLSIMSYSADPNLTNLTAVDIRTLKAIYDQPTVLLRGPSALSNGRYTSSIDLSVHNLNYASAVDYEVHKPTAYRYKITRAEADCKSQEGYSEKRPLDMPIKENLRDIYPENTAVKICVVGLNDQTQQEFSAYTNLFWLVGEDRAKAFSFSGLVHTDDCSGSLVRFDNSQPKDHAMVLTNAHCLGLEPGEVQLNRSNVTEFYPLEEQGHSPYFDQGATLTANTVLYASYGLTDLALLRLDQTYENLTVYSVRTLAREAPQVGQQVDVVTGLFSEGYTCRIEHIAPQLKEGASNFVNALRYDRDCMLFHGTSGSPMLDRKTGLIVGINSTGNDQGEPCTDNNPCEVEQDGQLTYQKGYGYALQTAILYSCLDSKRKFNLNKSGCELPKPQAAIAQP